jgi:hypothetical protein
MNSQRSPLYPTPSRWPLRSVAFAALWLTGGLSVLAAADGPTQPDPPVPLERPVLLAAVDQRGAEREAAGQRVADREPDCRCGVLHARDIESRIEGHVEQWESLARDPARRVAPQRAVPLHTTSFVEGVVGFPVRQFRLASDTPGDDGAGSD